MFTALKAQNNIAHGKRSGALGTLPRNVGALQGQLIKTALRVAPSARHNVGGGIIPNVTFAALSLRWAIW